MPLLITIWSLIFFSVAFAEEPLWPLSIEISQSSSFAEFRGMRFHAGIDLRTQQKNGLPVRAIADGFVSRASVQFRGYGYALYIDHPQMNTRVVYGHLQDFSGDLKSYIDGKLKKMGQRHGINDFFKADRFPVKRGQIVALSGETGMGPSHLHFEMRTLNDEPVAPAKYGFRPADSIFPTFHSMYLEPLAHGAVIDGSFLSARYSLKAKGKGGWILPQTPEVSGRTGMQLGISDTNGAGNRYGVEKIVFSVNDRVLLERIFHQYSYDDNRQCPWVYDFFKCNQKNTGYVYNLFKWPFDTLPFAAAFTAWSGCITDDLFADRRFEFKVDAVDFGGNSIALSGGILHQPADFSKIFTVADLETFKFVQTVQTTFSLIAVGEATARQSKRSAGPLFGRVTVNDAAGKTAELNCILRDGRAEIAFPKEKRWEKGAWLQERRILPDTTFIDTTGGKVAQEDGGNVQFPEGSLNFPVFATMRRVDLAPAAGGNARRGYLKAFSPVWQFSPDDVVFNAEARLSIVPENFAGDIKKLGVYGVSEPGSYWHNGEKVEGRALTFTSRTGGRFVILEDLVPPELKYSGQTSDYHLGKCYVFKVSDIGKGIDYLSASARINGQATEVYSDPDKAEVYVVRPATAKPHKIRLTIRDQAGNTASIDKNS
ncbi:hypothetical protein MASR1M12_16320 [Erysipelotrichia bacterium]